jgi:glucan phosphorylase
MRTAFNLPKIAYFSMEIALDPNMPTYSGGLGVLAALARHKWALFGNLSL